MWWHIATAIPGSIERRVALFVRRATSPPVSSAIAHRRPSSSLPTCVRSPAARRSLLSGLLHLEPLRVAVLGWVTPFKGAARVLESAQIIADRDLPIRIQVIGTIDGDAPPGLDVSGPYQTRDLQRLLADARPHLLWYAAQVPETYSYILSEGLEAGLPVLVPRLGAFPERVNGRPWSWIVDWNLSPDTGRQHDDGDPRTLRVRRSAIITGP